MKTLLALAASLLFLSTASRADTCRPIASFELHADWYGGVYIPVTIAGRRLHMLIDTGGTTSMLSTSTVSSLGLRPRPVRDLRISMYGGTLVQSFVRLNGMQIGADISPPTDFLVVPDGRLPNDISGTLAPDFLSRFDVDLDLSRARLGLLTPCPGGFPGSEAAVPFATDDARHIIVRVVLDGRAIIAYLDTGASRSDLSVETALSTFHLSATSPGMRHADGPDAEDGAFRYPFRELSLGNLTIAQPDIVLVPDRISRRPLSSPRMVVGMSILRYYRMLIGYHERVLYLGRP